MQTAIVIAGRPILLQDFCHFLALCDASDLDGPQSGRELIDGVVTPGDAPEAVWARRLLEAVGADNAAIIGALCPVVSDV